MLRRELFVLPSLHQLSHTIRLKSPIDYRLLRLSFAIATGMDGESGAGAVAMDDTMLTIEASIPLGATVPVIRLSLSQAATVRWMFGVDARNLLFHQVRRIPREPRVRPGVESPKLLLPAWCHLALGQFRLHPVHRLFHFLPQGCGFGRRQQDGTAQALGLRIR